jgi:hypothetical protein
MGDIFVENPALLKGQPKRTIGDYVESNGILVPRRFDTLDEARKSHKGVFLRSEHSQEYDGVSGLLDSYSLGHFDYVNGAPFRGVKSLDDVTEIVFDIIDRKIGEYGKKWTYVEFCDLLGVSPDDFKDETSFSLWENLGGYNRTVVADSSIPNRWHIMTIDRKNHTINNYSVFDSETGLQEYSNEFWELTDELKASLPSLIETYEAVRDLERFDPNHCPIMEFQTVGDRHYFLQYHRCRDFEEASFYLGRGAGTDEIELPFVRGATRDANGIECKTLFHRNEKRTVVPENPEEGALSESPKTHYTSLTLSKRKLQLLDNMNGPIGAFQGVVNGHDDRSELFKPQISAVFDKSCFDFIVPSGFYGGNNQQDKYLTLGIVSDGRKAYLRRVA